jgi:hypothetical protein
MDAKQTSPLTVDDIEVLLEKRTADNVSRHHKEIASLAAVISGSADPETITEVDRHLATCDDCRELLTVLYWAETRQGEDGAEPVHIERRAAQKKRIWRPLSLSAAAVFIGALSLIVLTLDKDHIDSENQFIPKGQDDDLIVAVQRGGDLFTASHLDKLESGDSLGLFYTASEPGYLAVFNRDDFGVASVLFPLGATQSAPVQKGEKISLPDGAVVEDGRRCEWIIAVFSDTARPLSALRRAVENAGETGAQCGLSLDVPGVRSKTVLSFTR